MRKANRLRRFWQVSQATFCTVQRAYILGQVAEWILSTTLDTLWCAAGTHSDASFLARGSCMHLG